ncbi:trypsin-like peptidase domain-containing protein [Sphingobacterium sp. JB170]|uniref:trypsin-like peptidase domain-containing protein n=1 Tax=Sphingobacterium sp. JB170 TaxID=1434842 RepID=UPI00097ECA48|nr:trypsin-like peptidase domain-containing protein [Sphingobacterium sp. JB170]SJN27808.1 [Genomic island nu Sa beta2] [Sphingobacterium sp. JB170]
MGSELNANQFTVRIKSINVRGSGIIGRLKEDEDYVYVFTAKHCILGEKFSNEASISDIKILDIYNGEEEKAELKCEAGDDLLLSSDKEDIAIIKLAIKRLAGAVEHLPFIRLALLDDNVGPLTFRGYPKYADKTKTLSGNRPHEDDEGRFFEIAVPDKFFDLFSPQPENVLVKGFSGAPVFQILEEQLYCFGIIHEFETIGNRFKATNSVAITELLAKQIQLYEPWVEQIASTEKLSKMLKSSSDKLGVRFDAENNYPVSLEREFELIAKGEHFTAEVNKNLKSALLALEAFYMAYTSEIQKFISEFGNRRISSKDAKEIKKPVTFKIFFNQGLQQYNFFKSHYHSMEWQSVSNEHLKQFLTELDALLTTYQVLPEALDRLVIRLQIPIGPNLNSVNLLKSELQRGGNVLEDVKKSLVDLTTFPNAKMIMVTGKGGNGKSQLLAHMSNRWHLAGHAVLMALGQRFGRNSDPSGQFLEQLEIKTTWKTFLSAMQAKSVASGKSSFLVIDALNEGKGLVLWNNNLISFLRSLADYSGIKVIMSYRDSFADGLFKGIDVPADLTLRHNGFLGKETEAMKVFFDRNGIDIDKVPFNAEFSNPLYLKLFCIAFGNGALVENLDVSTSIFMIIERVLAHVNGKLGEEHHYNYKSEKINLVVKAVDIFVKKLVELNEVQLPYEDAFLLIDAAVGMFLNKKGFVNGLVDEEIFQDNLSTDGATYLLDFAYERFGEHLKARQLLRGMSLDQIQEAFIPDGNFYQLFISSKVPIEKNKGLLEAMTVQIQDTFGMEFLTVAPAMDELAQGNSFVMSLIQNRGNIPISRATKKFIFKTMQTDSQTQDSLWFELLNRTDEEGFFNAEFLHEYLFSQTMAQRDAGWTIFINGEFDGIYDQGLISTIILRALETTTDTKASEQKIWLNGLALSWMLCSSNRSLRDQVTKALILVFKDNPSLLIKLMNVFDAINDPYILQRIYAIVYGVSVRAVSSVAFKEIGETVYKLIFAKPEVYPDLLLRDYARATIEHLAAIGMRFDFDLDKIKPPYKSKVFDFFPDNEEIDVLLDRMDGVNKEQTSGSKMLMKSMVTEYGRGTASYGDFGRYVFGSAVRNWKDVEENLLSNLAIKMIIEEFGYSELLHGEYDSRRGSGRSRRNAHVERIGKKYQWIAFYQILARLADNEKFYDRYSFTKEQGTFHGPWRPFVRDIDPTLVLAFKRKRRALPQWLEKPEFKAWMDQDTSWFSSEEDLPDLTMILGKTDEKNHEWLMLNGKTEWLQVEDKQSVSKRLNYQIMSFVCAKEDFQALLEYLLRQRTWDEQIHQIPSNYTVFNREYYYSPAYIDSDLADEESRVFEDEVLQATHDFVQEVTVTATHYNWEASADQSLERNIGLLKPAKSLFELLELKISTLDEMYSNALGEVVAMDQSVNYDSDPCLWIRKQDLLEMLEKKGKTIIWTVYGQKDQANSFQYDLVQCSRSVIYFERGKINVATRFSQDFD